MTSALLAAAATPIDLVAAREQMALSLGWHIVLACLGVGMPAITLLAEWRGHRTGDPVYRLLARRWARAMGVLFAVGAVSGTILSFEMGLLWPGLMGTYGQVIGLPFTMEAIAFFVEILGFELETDSPAVTTDGRPKRWVVVRPPGGGSGVPACPRRRRRAGRRGRRAGRRARRPP